MFMVYYNFLILRLLLHAMGRSHVLVSDVCMKNCLRQMHVITNAHMKFLTITEHEFSMVNQRLHDIN